MNKLFWEKVFNESNLLIIIPAIFVVGSLVWLFIFGLSSPESTRIYGTESLLTNQSGYETDYLVEFSNGDYTATNPYFILDPYKTAPLSGLLMFETEVAKEFKVIIKGKTIEGNIEYITDSLISHKIPIYGLYPGITNIIEIYEIVGIDTYTLVNTLSVDTEELPDTIILPSKVETSFAYFGSDLMLTLSNTSNMPVGFDLLGDVRWYLDMELAWGPDILSNGNLIFGYKELYDLYYTAELIEVDYLGKVHTEYIIPNGYHHEVEELLNGNLLVATNDFGGTVEDILIELDRISGEIIRTIDIDDYLDVLDGASSMWTMTDWFHLNSIHYDRLDNSILLSGRNQDIVINIDYDTLELNWVLGDPTDWDPAFVTQYFLTPVGLDFEWQYGQSDIDIMGNGLYLIFDSGIDISKVREEDVLNSKTYSRGVIYQIDSDLMTIEQIEEYGKELGNVFYSPEYSNVRAYALNNFLIHSGENTMINGELNLYPNYEIMDGDVLVKLSTTLEIRNGIEDYRMEINDSINKVIRVSLYDYVSNYSASEGIVLGSQLETERYLGGISTKINLLKTVPDDYNLEFEKEFNRLMVNGSFNKGDIVYLVLDGYGVTRRYLIPTVSQTFSPVYLDQHDDGTIDISYFINEEGISGRYDIYIIINGKEYDTYKNVIFD